jgi:hypothetical protein
MPLGYSPSLYGFAYEPPLENPEPRDRYTAASATTPSIPYDADMNQTMRTLDRSLNALEQSINQSQKQATGMDGTGARQTLPDCSQTTCPAVAARVAMEIFEKQLHAANATMAYQNSELYWVNAKLSDKRDQVLQLRQQMTLLAALWFFTVFSCMLLALAFNYSDTV